MSKIQLLKSSTYVSLFLLVGFLIFWNFQNYKRDKRELYMDLSDQLELACSEFRDSLIDRIFLAIDFDTTIDVHRDTFMRISSINLMPEVKALELSGKSRTLDNINTEVSKNYANKLTHIKLNLDHPSVTQERLDTAWAAEDTTIQVLIDPSRGDRQIVVWDGDMTQEDLKKRMSVDTIVGIDLEQGSTLRNHHDRDDIPSVYLEINEIFIRRLTNNKLIVNHEIQMIDSSQLSDMTIIIPYGENSTEKIAAVLFPNYHGFLVKKLLPSIAISLLLLGIISLSLLYLLKSWMAQERLTKVRHEFVSNMTHELKTPISTIAVALEAMQKYGVLDDKEKREEYLTISLHEAARLNILVDKVLKMSSLNEKNEMLSMSDVDFNALTKEVLNSMQLHFEKQSVQLNISIADEPLWVKGDKIHLTNVIYNLVDNAIKYADGEPMIGVYLTRKDQCVQLEITDKGRGISEQDLTRIFDRFYRVPSQGDRHEVKGHGLGLHYVKHIVERHEGTIAVSSKEKQGTSFIIRLPVKND